MKSKTKAPPSVKLPSATEQRISVCRHLQAYTCLIRTYSPALAEAEEAIRAEKQLNRRIAKLQCAS